VFVDRWWDYGNGFVRTGVGTDNTWRIYRGPIPAIPVKPAEGRKEWWIDGLSYATYLAGGYTNSGPCITIPPLVLAPVLRAMGKCEESEEQHWENLPTLRAAGDLLIDGPLLSPVELRAAGDLVADVANEWEDSPSLMGMGAAAVDPEQELTSMTGYGMAGLDPEQELTSMMGMGDLQV